MSLRRNRLSVPISALVQQQPLDKAGEPRPTLRLLAAYDADGDGDHDLMIHSIPSQVLYFVENEGGALAGPVIAAMVAGPGIAVGAPPLPGR